MYSLCQIDKQQIQELRECRWISDGSNLFFLGPLGLGKPHLVIALGREAIKRGYSTLFMSDVSLLGNLQKARIDGNLNERLSFYCKYTLLIIDELGYLPLEAESGALFFQLKVPELYRNPVELIR